MEPKPKAHLFTFAVMALFIFVFLGSEYHFDIAYGELAGPDSVVGAQASILATSAIGLVGYSLVNRTAAARHRSILAGVLGTVSALFLVATQLTQNANALLSLGCLLFLILGMLGNATYFSVAQTHYASNSLSRLVGTSYAAGLLAQFLLHSLAPNSVIEAAIIGASIIALGFALAARRNVLHVVPVRSALPEKDQRTANERDVLSAVCSSEETLQCIADDMGISLRALQKHLTSIYRKSDTQSRAGLCSAALTEPLEH